MDIKEIASQLALECLRRNKGNLSELDVLNEYLRLKQSFEDRLNSRKQKSVSSFDIL